MPYTVSAVDRALELLETLAGHPQLGVTELAERTGHTKSLVFRLLYTLEQRGYVHKDPTRRTYSLGYRPLFLADQTRRQSRLISVAEPFLDRLAAATHENVLLTVREDLHSVCVAMRPSPQPLRLFAEVGKSGPLHAGGGPKVLLAYAPLEIRNAVCAGDLRTFTPTSISDPQRLESALAQIRSDGWTVSVGELDPSAFSIAAPVHDHSGEVVAALSVAGPISRLDDHHRSRHRDNLLDVAGALSARLGHRPPVARSA